jgi:hypothetical protein
LLLAALRLAPHAAWATFIFADEAVKMGFIRDRNDCHLCHGAKTNTEHMAQRDEAHIAKLQAAGVLFDRQRVGARDCEHCHELRMPDGRYVVPQKIWEIQCNARARWMQNEQSKRDAQRRLDPRAMRTLHWRDREVRSLLEEFKRTYKTQDDASADAEYLGYCDPLGEKEARAREFELPQRVR